MTTTVNVHEAKTQLSRLLLRVGLGEEVIIARAGKPVARLVAIEGNPLRRTPLWWIADDPQLSTTARQVMENADNTLYLSTASGWEMVIKVRLGKLRPPGDVSGYVSEQIALKAIQVLPVEMSHVLQVYTLPGHHCDPFDRILVAQSQVEQLPILTIDPLIAQYPVTTIW